MPHAPSLSEFYSFLKFIWKVIVLLAFVVELTVNLLLRVLDALIPRLCDALTYLPSVCSFISGAMYTSIQALTCVLEFITWMTTPAVVALDAALYLALEEAQYEQVRYYAEFAFSSAAVWAISLLLIVAGSLIVATEERVPNRNQFRPKTTVPIFCLMVGCIMHFDAMKYSPHLPTVAIFTGALWYCISLAHDDLKARERHAHTHAYTYATHRRRYGSDTGTNTDLLLQEPRQGQGQGQGRPVLAAAFRQMRSQGRASSQLRRRLRSSQERDLLTPSKLAKSASSGALATVDGGVKIILEESCPICLVDYVHDEVLRALPCCKHTFHETCVGLWLESHENCPLCRQQLTTLNGWGHLVHALFE